MRYENHKNLGWKDNTYSLNSCIQVLPNATYELMGLWTSYATKHLLEWKLRIFISMSILKYINMNKKS